MLTTVHNKTINMLSNTIIGLSGLKGSGKSTVAKILCEKHNFIEFAFADPLKRGVQEMFGLSDFQLYGDYIVKEMVDPFWNVSPRVLMQIVGTELMRNELPRHIPDMNNIWIRMMEKRIKECNHPRIVISDCRFLDESCMIRNNNGLILRICRNGIYCEDFHESEKMAFEVDYTIFNTGTIEDLEENIVNTLKTINII